MNNPNPFLPQGSFLEQKDKARTRVKIAVFFSISLSVVALMALLIQGCRKPNDTAENGSGDEPADASAHATCLHRTTGADERGLYGYQR